ncbi:MAG: ATP-binding cassette domain-containing protein [Bacteroidales bacterium]
MNNVLEIDSVRLSFGNRQILQDIWLKLETGRVTGLLGRNGSGKSSLMQIIFGELMPEDKSLRMNGIPILGCYRNPHDMMYLPQFSFIPGSLSVSKVFQLFKIDYACFLDYFPHFEQLKESVLAELSGGERRVIEVYCILCAPTGFAILDEPFSQIMPVHIEVFKQIIANQKRTKGILLSDHYYRDIIDSSDAIYILANGKTTLISSLKQIEELGYARMDLG